jgi:hypothetical protein
MSTDLSSANAAQSLQRLAQHLSALIRSLKGEDPDPETDDHFFDPDAFRAVLRALEDELLSQTNDDWAIEREIEIARLGNENQELRRILGIDPESLVANGVHVEERLLTGSPRNRMLMASRRRSGSGGGIGGSDTWSQRAPTTGYGHGGNGNSPNAPEQEYQQIQLQRAMDTTQNPHVQVGMRMEGRRPAMFGPAGGVARGGVPPSLWANNPHPLPPQQPPERPWHPQGGSTLDLSR